MKIFIVFFFLLSLTGCGRMSDEATEELLKRDPSFRSILENKRSVESEINSLRDQYRREKEESRAKTNAINESLASERAKIKAQIEALENRLQPEIDGLKAKLYESRSLYADKKLELKDDIYKLKNIEGVLSKKGDLSLSGDEVSVWSRRIEKIKKDINSTRRQLERLAADIDILKTELRLLEQ